MKYRLYFTHPDKKGVRFCRCSWDELAKALQIHQKQGYQLRKMVQS